MGESVAAFSETACEHTQYGTVGEGDNQTGVVDKVDASGSHPAFDFDDWLEPVRAKCIVFESTRVLRFELGSRSSFP
jgi:hypothetical protein